jgi:hypothetical protein
VAVVGVALQRFGMQHELAVGAVTGVAMQFCSEPIRLAGLAPANALDLGRV